VNPASVMRSRTDFAEALDESHDGEVMYTFSRKTQVLTLAMSTISDEAIEQVVPRVVGTVRAAAHELGLTVTRVAAVLEDRPAHCANQASHPVNVNPSGCQARSKTGLKARC
jgi:hypothetical protein